LIENNPLHGTCSDDTYTPGTDFSKQTHSLSKVYRKRAKSPLFIGGEPGAYPAYFSDSPSAVSGSRGFCSERDDAPNEEKTAS
jgi:hypothetical protein